MDFLWDENNSAHILAHGIDQELAEKVFWAGIDDMHASRVRHRYLIEAEVQGRLFRLVCDISKSGTVYPITCFPLGGGAPWQDPRPSGKK